MNARCCLALAALVLCGCGREARREALGLGRTLTQERAAFASATTQEKDLVAATRAWAEGIASGGAGTGDRLAQNATVAADLAKSVESVSGQVGQMRKAIYDLAIQQEFPQSIRAALITQITKRQRMLQDIRGALAEAAAQFQELRQSRGYKGDSYPNSIDKLTQILQAYKPPADIIGDALSALRDKYGLKEADLVGGA